MTIQGYQDGCGLETEFSEKELAEVLRGVPLDRGAYIGFSIVVKGVCCFLSRFLPRCVFRQVYVPSFRFDDSYSLKCAAT